MNIGADFLPRLGSALVLGPMVIAAAAWGGRPFVLLCFLASLMLLWEWAKMVRLPRLPVVLGLGGGGIACALFALVAGPPQLILALPAGALAAALMVRGALSLRFWALVGVFYAGALACSLTLLRLDSALGLVAVVWLLAVVWTTDVAAYFCGRLIGGPKLWPRVSPNKTWSGSIGGVVFAVAAGMLTVRLAGVDSAFFAAPAAFAASICCQAGDLFESAMKRRFGVKDSGHLIPGHGGLMDRLDGLVAAALLAGLIGVLRHPAAPAAGLLVW
ncbi:phosphatidate cytidylyltransferase [Ancylobacter oerskovii]|uniref:Phosphatidate cytidylyltransferase n=1 Tax=Ancylobacter oerskovii TaxID=459519 RepID=A0ABW4Z310_9HYPH|nr:phosphatidate cytidylyltransferase [Ancylobacter oerskovii]MBS7546360.1 phosphatidate cytidylyltransferase [Ancylobacter oerskovii]